MLVRKNSINQSNLFTRKILQKREENATYKKYNPTFSRREIQKKHLLGTYGSPGCLPADNVKNRNSSAGNVVQ